MPYYIAGSVHIRVECYHIVVDAVRCRPRFV